MAVTASDVKVAECEFIKNPSAVNVARYFSKAREAEENGELDDDEWLNVCSVIETWLWGQTSAHYLRKHLVER